MKAEVRQYGDKPIRADDNSLSPLRTGLHWALFVDGTWIADTADPIMRNLYQKIAIELNLKETL